MYFNQIYSLADIPGPPPPPPPHHHANQRLPPPSMPAEHPPWGGGQHPEFAPPPHGFNGHSPHVRQRQHPPVQDDPSLVPNVPYFDLPAGLMAPLVKVSQSMNIDRRLVAKGIADVLLPLSVHVSRPSLLLWFSSRTMITNPWILKTSGCPLRCRLAIGC